MRLLAFRDKVRLRSGVDERDVRRAQFDVSSLDKNGIPAGRSEPSFQCHLWFPDEDERLSIDRLPELQEEVELHLRDRQERHNARMRRGIRCELSCDLIRGYARQLEQFPPTYAEGFDEIVTITPEWA